MARKLNLLICELGAHSAVNNPADDLPPERFLVTWFKPTTPSMREVWVPLDLCTAMAPEQERSCMWDSIIVPLSRRKLLQFNEIHIRLPASSFLPPSFLLASPLYPSSFLLPPSAPYQPWIQSFRPQCSRPDQSSNLWINAFPAGVPRKLSIERFPPAFHRKLWVKAFLAGPPPQAPDQSAPCLIWNAHSGSKCPLRYWYLNHKESLEICRVNPKKQMICHIMPRRMLE